MKGLSTLDLRLDNLPAGDLRRLRRALPRTKALWEAADEA